MSNKSNPDQNSDAILLDMGCSIVLFIYSETVSKCEEQVLNQLMYDYNSDGVA